MGDGDPGAQLGSSAARSPSTARRPRFLRRAAVIAIPTVAIALGITLSVVIANSPGPVLRSGPQEIQVVTPLPEDPAPGAGYRYYAARPDLTVNGRSAVDTFGVTDVVALTDGTVFALQDSRISVADSDDHVDGVDWGRALVRISADGVAGIVESPYANRELGRDVAPACASANGDLYAYNEDDGSLVARSPSGDWRAVTAAANFAETVSRGDGGPAVEATLVSFHGCAVTSDGSIYVTDSCLVRRIAPDGTIETIAGRPDINDGSGSGCGAVANGLATHTGSVPAYDGPAVDAELGWLVAIAAGPDDSVWISAMSGIQQITPDGWLHTTPVPTQMAGVTAISSLASTFDGRLISVYGDLGPKGVSSRDPVTGVWTTLVDLHEEPPIVGVEAPAPLNTLDLYGADLAVGGDRLYFGVASGPNAGIVAVPVS